MLSEIGSVVREVGESGFALETVWTDGWIETEARNVFLRFQSFRGVLAYCTHKNPSRTLPTTSRVLWPIEKRIAEACCLDSEL